MFGALGSPLDGTMHVSSARESLNTKMIHIAEQDIHCPEDVGIVGTAISIIALQYATLRNGFGQEWDSHSFALHGLITSAIASGTEFLRQGRLDESEACFRDVYKWTDSIKCGASIIRMRAIALNNLGCLKCR